MMHKLFNRLLIYHKMVNIAEIVREYIRKNPDIKENIDAGLINSSALARHIMDQESLENFDAVLAAIKRCRKNRTVSYGSDILDKSNLEMISDIAIIILKRSYNNIKIITNIINNTKKINSIRFIDTAEGFSIITDNILIEKISTFFPEDQILKIQRNLGGLIILSPETIERAKGYLNYVTTILFRANINIIHLISFYNDTTIILESKDLTDAFKIISSKIME